MDCPSEENLIRIRLDNLSGIIELDFDLENRFVFVFHNNKNTGTITCRLAKLNLGTTLIENKEIEEGVVALSENKKQQKMLWTVLSINIAFFVIEISTGFIAIQWDWWLICLTC